MAQFDLVLNKRHSNPLFGLSGINPVLEVDQVKLKSKGVSKAAETREDVVVELRSLKLDVCDKLEGRGYELVLCVDKKILAVYACTL